MPCSAPALNRRLDPDALLLAFAAVMLLAATGMLLRARTVVPAKPHHRAERAQTLGAAPSAALRLILAGLGIGALTGLLGVGGGFVIVPVLVVLLDTETHLAVGTSLLVIALNSAVALAARAPEGTFDASVLVPFTVAAVAGSFAGQRVADRLPARRLTEAFAGLLIGVAGYVGGSALL